MPFAQPIGAQPSTVGSSSGPLVSQTVATNGAYWIAKDTSSFQSIFVSLQYFGNPVFPSASGDYLQAEFIWYSDATQTVIVDVETVEVNSDYCPDFTGKVALITLPVRGPSLVVVFNTGSGGAGPYTVTMLALGSNRVVTRPIFQNDQANYRSSDLIVLGKSSAVAIPAASGSGPYFGGLSSGPAHFVASVAFATGGATVGNARFRFTYGTSGLGWPDVNITQPNTAYGLGISASLTGYMLPRRPVQVAIVNTASAGGNAISNWNMNIVRDETG